MSQRALLSIGVVAVAAAFLIAAIGLGTGRLGAPMMGWLATSSGQSISMDKAQQSVQSFLSSTGDQDLKIDELIEFQQNFYSLIKEKSTGVGAFELLVNKSSSEVTFEPGPNMMWNTKYSMMGRGGMMGGFRPFITTTSMPIGSVEASGMAQNWLDQHLSGDAAGTADAFYGYYTFHFEKEGQIAGMLSVNGYSGQVWYHTWHGAFIQAREVGG